MLLGDAGDAQSSEDDNDDDDENDDDDDENDEVTNEDEERPGGDLPSFCISISKSSKIYYQLKITIEMAINVKIKMTFPFTAFANEQ